MCLDLLSQLSKPFSNKPIDFIADKLCCAQINKEKPEGLIVTAFVEMIGFPFCIRIRKLSIFLSCLHVTPVECFA